MNQTADKTFVDQFGADEVIIATGAVPCKVPISGIDGDNVIEDCQYLLKKKEAGQTNVIIGGGLTGVEIAYDLVNHGKKVAILEMKDKILEGKFLSEANSNMLRQIIKDYDIPVYTGASVKLINENGVEFEYQGETRVVAADTVITATGYISQVTIPDGLKDLPGVHIIGDVNKVGNLMDAVWGAYDVALNI